MVLKPLFDHKRYRGKSKAGVAPLQQAVDDSVSGVAARRRDRPMM
jgi:hypothetical protein